MLSAGMVIGSALLMTVVVEGEDAVPAAAWSKAQSVATHILDSAGVHAVWGARTAPQATLFLRLSQTRPSSLHPDAAGYAVLSPEGRYAAVFLPGVARTAAQTEVDAGTVLGAIMAHEIGHLLLGPAHSGGVMSARLDRRQMRAAERGELLFRGEDARQIRGTLTALIK